MRKNRSQSQKGSLFVVLLVLFIFVAFVFITYSKKNAEFEEREAMVKEPNAMSVSF